MQPSIFHGITFFSQRGKTTFNFLKPTKINRSRTVPVFFLSSSTYINQLQKKKKMVKTTIIARISDGLPLAASMDDEQVVLRASYKKTHKKNQHDLGWNRVGRVQRSSQDHL